MQCTEAEICAVLGGSNGALSPHTLNRWCKETYGKNQTFCKVFEQKKEAGKVSLRRIQWVLAQKSVSMAIFLGKNYLGQSDDPNKVETSSDGPVIITGEDEIQP